MNIVVHRTAGVFRLILHPKYTEEAICLLKMPVVIVSAQGYSIITIRRVRLSPSLVGLFCVFQSSHRCRPVFSLSGKYNYEGKRNNLPDWSDQMRLSGHPPGINIEIRCDFNDSMTGTYRAFKLQLHNHSDTAGYTRATSLIKALRSTTRHLRDFNHGSGPGL